MSSELTLATMERHLPLSSSRRTTSPAVLHPTNVFIPFMYFNLCLPLALVPSTSPSKQYFSRLVHISVWLRCPSCLLRMVVVSCPEVPAISNTARLVLLAIQGYLSTLLMNHVSKAFNFFFMSDLTVQLSHP